jgi:hypothetical protein
MEWTGHRPRVHTRQSDHRTPDRIALWARMLTRRHRTDHARGWPRIPRWPRALAAKHATTTNGLQQSTHLHQRLRTLCRARAGSGNTNCQAHSVGYDDPRDPIEVLHDARDLVVAQDDRYADRHARRRHLLDGPISWRSASRYRNKSALSEILRRRADSAIRCEPGEEGGDLRILASTISVFLFDDDGIVSATASNGRPARRAGYTSRFVLSCFRGRLSLSRFRGVTFRARARADRRSRRRAGRPG